MKPKKTQPTSKPKPPPAPPRTYAEEVGMHIKNTLVGIEATNNEIAILQLRLDVLKAQYRSLAADAGIATKTR